MNSGQAPPAVQMSGQPGVSNNATHASSVATPAGQHAGYPSGQAVPASQPPAGSTPSMPSVLYFHKDTKDAKDKYISTSINPLEASSSAAYFADGTMALVGKKVAVHKIQSGAAVAPPAQAGNAGGVAGFMASFKGKGGKVETHGQKLAQVSTGSMISSTAKITYADGERMKKVRKGGLLFGLLNRKWTFEHNERRYYWNSKSRNLKLDASGKQDPVIAVFESGWTGPLTIKRHDDIDLDTMVITAVAAMLLEDKWNVKV